MTKYLLQHLIFNKKVGSTCIVEKATVSLMTRTPQAAMS